jgi:MFS family permease
LSAVQVLFLVFIPFALGHYLSWLLRTVNAMLAPHMLADAHLSVAQLGMLTSAYFLAFALAQLPVGMALDRYGPRRVQCVMLLIGALGTLAFAHADGFAQMAAARGVIGVGLAACFMSAMKAISTWISPQKAPSVQGYLIAAGGLGAATATLPVRLALQYTDWRGIFSALALCCAALAAAIWLLAPDAVPSGARPKRRVAALAAFREILGHRAFHDTAVLVLPPHAIYFGVQGLWISRWLAEAGGIDQQAVAWLLYLGMVAVIFGSIAVGMLAQWAANHGRQLIDVAAIGIAIFLLMQCAMVAGWRPGMPMLAVAFMLTGTITGLEYTIVSQAMPRHLTGRAATLLNLMIFTAAFAVQAGFGALVASAGYRGALCMLLLLQIPGLVHYLLRRLRSRNRAHTEASPAIR